MSFDGRNSAVIKRAFSRLRKSKDAMVQDGMRRIMKDAMEYAISQHDHDHFGHRIHENSYGWALVHDGNLIELQINGARHGHGDAEDQLREVAGGIGRRGWVGILLASMVLEFNGRKPVYFEIDYEVGIFDATTDKVEEWFKTYFKPIA